MTANINLLKEKTAPVNYALETQQSIEEIHNIAINCMNDARKLLEDKKIFEAVIAYRGTVLSLLDPSISHWKTSLLRALCSIEASTIEKDLGRLDLLAMKTEIIEKELEEIPESSDFDVLQVLGSSFLTLFRLSAKKIYADKALTCFQKQIDLLPKTKGAKKSTFKRSWRQIQFDAFAGKGFSLFDLFKASAYSNPGIKNIDHLVDSLSCLERANEIQHHPTVKYLTALIFVILGQYQGKKKNPLKRAMKILEELLKDHPHPARSLLGICKYSMACLGPPENFPAEAIEAQLELAAIPPNESDSATLLCLSDISRQLYTCMSRSPFKAFFSLQAEKHVKELSGNPLSEMVVKVFEIQLSLLNKNEIDENLDLLKEMLLSYKMNKELIKYKPLIDHFLHRASQWLLSDTPQKGELMALKFDKILVNAILVFALMIKITDCNPPVRIDENLLKTLLKTKGENTPP